MSGSARAASSAKRSSSSETGSGAVVSSCGYWAARALADLLVGVERRLNESSVSMCSRVKDWVAGSKIRAQAVDGCWEPVYMCLEVGEEPLTFRLRLEGSDWEGVIVVRTG